MGGDECCPQIFMRYIFGLFGQNERSPQWSEVRKIHLSKQPFCQACGKKDNLEVHHIEPYHVNPSKELDPTNLITLCSKHCHLTFGHLMDFKSWNKDVVTDCSEFLSKTKQRPYHENFSYYPKNNFFVMLLDFVRSLWYN